jgi:hypothetical protein
MTISIPPELEKAITERAAQQNVSPEDVVREALGGI